MWKCQRTIKNDLFKTGGDPRKDHYVQLQIELEKFLYEIIQISICKLIELPNLFNYESSKFLFFCFWESKFLYYHITGIVFIQLHNYINNYNTISVYGTGNSIFT